MQAEIISIGNELLNGTTINTNASFIAQKLYLVGISVRRIDTVGDNEADIRGALKTAVEEAEIVLITGGLGPTHDDITKKVVTDFFGDELILNEEILREVEAKFQARGISMPPVNRSQAMVPRSARLMANPVGTAPGMIFDREGKLVVVMPGVPREMKAMMENEVIPLVQEKCPTCRVQVDLFRTTGIPESAIYQKIETDLAQFASYEIAFLPKFTGVDLRVVRRGADIEDKEKFDRFAQMLNRHIGEYIYTTSDEELEAVVGRLLRERQMTIAVAESITGGLIQDMITRVPGSSAYFMGGMVTYSNESKMKFLEVTAESLQQFGSVSEAVAREMATGVRQAVETDIGVSTTGIAGPTGSTPQKPIGLVYIGVAREEHTIVRKFLFGSDREINKQRAAQAALELVRRSLLNLPV
ncbi:MAG: competence/damage-inducible protein A [Calditrichia bacterium]